MNQRRTQLATALSQFYAKPVARVSVELLLSLLAVIFFAAFAIRPTLVTMSDLIKEIEDKRELNGRLSQKIAALSTAQSEFMTLQSRLDVLDEALPSEPRLIEALKIIEKIASDRQLAIQGLVVNELPPEEVATVPFSQTERQQIIAALTVTGDYPSLRQFVEDVRNSQRTFIIDTVTFSTGEEIGQKTLQVTITIAIPYFGVGAKK
ncbi:MAG: type 4a pilus biogenesis protein PilO [bacterium]|nr:type 4a pilus biogenesis protein PilO [bacterium]